MSVTQGIRRKPRAKTKNQRLHRMQEQTRHGASRAAERIGPTALQARGMAAERVFAARRWGAPRLERAGRYVEGELGPRVGSVLSTTANRVEPARSKSHRVRNAAMMMIAALVAMGVAGALATRRNAAQTDSAGMPETESEPAGNGQVRTP